MTKRRKKVVKHEDLVSVEVLMSRDMKDAAETVAKRDQKTRSQYIRDLILFDARRRGALPGEERT